MKITTFFDVSDFNHVRAFENLLIKGAWPNGFIPDGVSFQDGWMTLITSMLADAYINHMKLAVLN